MLQLPILPLLLLVIRYLSVLTTLFLTHVSFFTSHHVSPQAVLVHLALSILFFKENWS